MEKALNANGVCAALNISLPTTYKLLRSGRIPAVKIGRDWRVSPEEVQKFLRGGVEVVSGAEKAEAIQAAE